MTIGPNGLALIKSFEGLRLTAYQDVVGIWTIGYGHTRDVIEGDAITEDHADLLLLDDLQSAEWCVDDCAPGLNQNQYDACVSFAFNLGCTAFRKSTLVKMIQSGSFNAAADQFLRWDHAGGKVVDGLTRRRQAERDLFLQPQGDV